MTITAIHLLVITVPAPRRFPQFSPASLAKLIPSASPEALDLIGKLIAWNPDARLSSEQALRHQYFAVRARRSVRVMYRTGCCMRRPRVGPLHGLV